jgi:hypothetical protein
MIAHSLALRADRTIRDTDRITHQDVGEASIKWNCTPILLPLKVPAPMIERFLIVSHIILIWQGLQAIFIEN